MLDAHVAAVSILGMWVAESMESDLLIVVSLSSIQAGFLFTFVLRFRLNINLCPPFPTKYPPLFSVPDQIFTCVLRF